MSLLDSKVAHIVDELTDCAQRIAAVRELSSTMQLLELARYYNWDDGLSIPRAISEHPLCDLGLALHLFHLAEGTVYLTSPEHDWGYQIEWAEFCKLLSQRIISGYYDTVAISFVAEFTTVQCFKLRRQGVPEIFLTPISP